MEAPVCMLMPVWLTMFPFMLEKRFVKVGVMGQFSTKLQEEQPGQAMPTDKLAATGESGEDCCIGIAAAGE